MNDDVCCDVSLILVFLVSYYQLSYVPPPPCIRITLDEWMLLKGDETPPGSAPPVFTPPDVPSFMLAPQQVIVTQPTPSVEHGPPIGTKCLLLYTL